MRLINKSVAGQRRVYDIEVAEHHNFYANGINVHNCTGLQVPTIAVATGGGTSVIKHNGTVVNSSVTHAHQAVDIKGTTLFVNDSARHPYFATNIGGLGSAFPLTTYGNYGQGGGWQITLGKLIAAARNQEYGYLGREVYGGKTNEAASIRGLGFRIANTFNTGHLIGDIRRAYLADVDVGSVSGTELVTNGTFDTDTSGWGGVSSGVLSVDASRLLITNGNFGGAIQTVTVVPGKTYIVTGTYTAGTAGTGRVVAYYGNAGGTSVQKDVTTGPFFMTFVGQGASCGLALTILSGTAGVTGYFDNISVKECSADRSYKAQGASITGTLNKSQVALAAQTVAYSGFSAANYLREPYNADLDFGTGEWNASAWVNVPVNLQLNQNLATYSNDFVAGWIGDGVLVTANYETVGSLSYSRLQQPAVSTGGNRLYKFSPITVTQANSNTSIYVRRVTGSTDRLYFDFIGAWAPAFAGTYYDPVTQTFSGPNASSFNIQIIDSDTARLYVTAAKYANAGSAYWQLRVENTSGTLFGSGTGGVSVAGFQMSIGAALLSYEGTGATVTLKSHPVTARSYSSGALITFGIDGSGFMAATAFDGTTTRTVTTTAAYNTATWIKPEAVYTTDGTLAIRVNGVEVAATRGTPLLTLSNSNAVLTIGNSYALDAAFPGSIALLKLSATAPTAEQSQWMYEQEKQMFRAGAQVTLPDAGSIVDLTYDDATDKWIAVSAANESEWSGLVRTSVTASPAGSYTKVAAASGVQLQARSTTSPGVDITIPSYGLREELVRRAESAARLARNMVTFDYVGGFTANTTTGSTAIASVASLTYPVSYVGARISGAGIPANTTVVAVSGTTIYMSAAATATASAVQISFVDFNLPLGYEAKEVSTAGAAKIEGSTKDFTRLFDGFKETIRFGTAPGYNVAVQIQATRSAA